MVERIHVGLGVVDFDASVRFYRDLLGISPSKVRPGYAKFEPKAPSVNLSLHQREGSTGAHPGLHFGIEVASTDAVAQAQSRLSLAGWSTRLEPAVTCCYAVQDKVWVDDPEGNAWEIFVVTTADTSEFGGSAQDVECCDRVQGKDACC